MVPPHSEGGPMRAYPMDLGVRALRDSDASMIHAGAARVNTGELKDALPTDACVAIASKVRPLSISK